jgi:hypothetical protein
MAETLTIRTASSTEVVKIASVGPQGPKGDKGDPGDVSGSIAWDNVSSKPTTFPPEAHTHTASQVTDFNTAAALAAPVQSVNGLTGGASLSRNNIGATRVLEQIDGTSGTPTQINLTSYYNATSKSLNVAVVLNSDTANSHGSVFLPLLDKESVGRVSVRLNLNLGADPSLVRVQTTDGVNAVNVFPSSLFGAYDEISVSQDYVFVWLGDRWDLEILAHEASTTAHDLRKPDHGGLLAAFRGYGAGGQPSAPTSNGSIGQLAWGYDTGAERLYICVAANTWRRVPITTWS